MSKINFFFEDVNKFKLNKSLHHNLAVFLSKNENKKLGAVSVIFCSDDYLLKLNQEYLGHNYFTDIITFDYCKDSVISGDLFISLDRISDNAKKYNTIYEKELLRVFIHGLLHLCGYKDKTIEEQNEMRAREEFYLKGMDFDKENV